MTKNHQHMGAASTASHRFFLQFAVTTWVVLAGQACARADPPVETYLYVQMPSLTEAAKDFPEAARQEFAKALEIAHSSPHNKRMFFREGDGSFTQVQEFELFRALTQLIKPHVAKNEIALVEAFFKTILEAKMIQGYELSRRGGSFYVDLKLTLDEEEIWTLSRQYRPLPGDSYRGRIIFSTLGVRKADRSSGKASSS